MNEFISVAQAPHTDLDDGNLFAQLYQSRSSPHTDLDGISSPHIPQVDKAPHTDLNCISNAQLAPKSPQIMLLVTTSIIILPTNHLLVITDHTPVSVTDVTNQWTIKTCP